MPAFRNFSSTSKQKAYSSCKWLVVSGLSALIIVFSFKFDWRNFFIPNVMLSWSTMVFKNSLLGWNVLLAFIVKQLPSLMHNCSLGICCKCSFWPICHMFSCLLTALLEAGTWVLGYETSSLPVFPIPRFSVQENT